MSLGGYTYIADTETLKSNYELLQKSLIQLINETNSAEIMLKAISLMIELDSTYTKGNR